MTAVGKLNKPTFQKLFKTFVEIEGGDPVSFLSINKRVRNFITKIVEDIHVDNILFDIWLEKLHGIIIEFKLKREALYEFFDEKSGEILSLRPKQLKTLNPSARAIYDLLGECPLELESREDLEKILKQYSIKYPKQRRARNLLNYQKLFEEYDIHVQKRAPREDPQNKIEEPPLKKKIEKSSITLDLNCSSLHEKKERLRVFREKFEEFLHMVPRPENPCAFYFFENDPRPKFFQLNDQETLQNFLNVLNNEGVFNKDQLEENAESVFYNKEKPLEIEFVSRIVVKDYELKKDSRREYHEKGGEFYPFGIDLKLLPEELRDTIVRELRSAQIFPGIKNESGKIRTEFNLNCFCYALQEAKCPEEILINIRRLCLGRYQTLSSLKEICKELNVFIEVITERETSKNKTRREFLGKDSQEPLFKAEMFIVREKSMKGDHWIFNKDVPITKFFMDNFEEISKYAVEKQISLEKLFRVNKFVKATGKFVEKSDRKTSGKMIDLFNFVKSHGWFYEYSLSDVLEINSDLTPFVYQELNHLEAPEYSSRNIKPIEEKTKNEPSSFFYADFEAATQGKHIPYCASYSQRDSSSEKFEVKTLYGTSCVVELMEALPDNSLTYFHNLSYDGRFLWRYAAPENLNKKGNKIYQMTLNYHGKKLMFRDSYVMITSPLRNFPSMFDLGTFQKELFPYNYYSIYRVNNNVGKISDAGKFENKPWREEEYRIFNENIDKIPGCRLSDDTFDMEKYCAFYCEQDVRILKMGHMKFRELILQELRMNIDKSLTISSLANKYFTNEVFAKIPDLKEYSGVVRHFIQQCVIGGRCMTRDNKKWHTHGKISDYDACSLYPSAVHRLLIPTGAPKVIPDEWLGTSRYLLEHSMEEQQREPSQDQFISAYVAEINIVKVGKNRHFPLISHKTKQGNRNENTCGKMFVDNFTLEDLIQYQDIEFEILRGYYWTGAKSDLFSKKMAHIYDLRKQYKKEHNPLQLVLKLLMNSTYGKTIQKPINTQIVCKKITNRVFNKATKEWEERYDSDNYQRKNSHKIISGQDLGENTRCFEVRKSFDKYYVPNLIGVQILSMSKRIMNEVICTAEDLGIMIFYQDTDSIHIPVSEIPRLENRFKEIFGRELRGTDMGQFHPDFESDSLKGEIWAVESVFLGKKAYVDKLTDASNEIDYHLRLKGIPNDVLGCQMEDPLDLYRSLLDEKNSYKFNLLQLHPSFKMEKFGDIFTKEKFERKISFKGEFEEVFF